jgi:hypothetical protein
VPNSRRGCQSLTRGASAHRRDGDHPERHGERAAGVASAGAERDDDGERDVELLLDRQ